MRWSRTEVAPEGLRYLPEFIDAAEEHALLYQLAALPFQAVVMRGVTAKRTVVHYGYDYGYDSWRIVPTAAVPSWLQPLRLRAATLIGVAPAALVDHVPNGAREVGCVRRGLITSGVTRAARARAGRQARRRRACSRSARR